MTTSAAARATYRETFDDGPGGWFGFAGNHLGIAPLLIRDSCAVSRSPWWIDYNHAPPGAGYMHLLYMLHTRGAPGEYLREIAGPNRFIAGGFGTNFTNARITLRLRGELLTRGTQLYFLAQGVHDGVCSGWLLTDQPISVTAEWTEQTITCLPMIHMPGP
jgi:hypothetical protein